MAVSARNQHTMAGTRKSTGNRRPATAHEKAVLRAAKERGLHKIDLRKGLTRYARNLVKEFEGVYRQESSVVSIPKNQRKNISGLNVKRGKVIVPKKSIDEVARFDKKRGVIVARNKKGDKRVITLRKQRKAIVFKEGTTNARKRTFSGPDGGAAKFAEFASRYDNEDEVHEISFDEYWDPFEEEWLRMDDDYEPYDVENNYGEGDY